MWCVESVKKDQKLIIQQHQAALDNYLANNPILTWPVAIKLQRALRLPECTTDIMTRAHPKHEEMRQWFEEGRLPCSFLLQPIWEPILAQLDHLNATALKKFVQLAAVVEKELVSQLEVQLAENRNGLLALSGEGSPKLSLLLNCFGANLETIHRFRHYDSMDLLSIRKEKWELTSLPKDQRTVVLYTRERLKKGKIPFGEHDCALCKCTTAEEMANFLNENGLQQVTADIIRQTGASGRGALLFLSVKDLQLRLWDKRALNKSRKAHSNCKN